MEIRLSRYIMMFAVSCIMLGCSFSPQDTDLSAIRVHELVKTTVGGHPLQIKDFTPGHGDGAKPGHYLKVHFMAKNEDNRSIFSTYDKKRPYAFKLGAGEVIAAWDYGLVGAKVGTKRRLIVPPALGYDDLGVMGHVDPNQPLIFDIEVLAIGAHPWPEKAL